MCQIGVGILSTNRPRCLKRLVESIERFTKNLNTVDIFISDDSNIEKDFIQVDDFISQKKSYIKFKHVGERVGVSRNTNYVLQMLKDCKYKLLLNNDVEVLSFDWESLYVEAMQRTGFHAFCFRQLGLWGACKEGQTGKLCTRPDKRSSVSGVEIATIEEKPHGAILALDDKAFDTVGYFDEEFGAYGAEHHDYFFRISESGIQPKGIHDLCNSNSYFKIYNEESCLTQEERMNCFKKGYARLEEKKKEQKKELYIGFKK